MTCSDHCRCEGCQNGGPSQSPPGTDSGTSASVPASLPAAVVSAAMKATMESPDWTPRAGKEKRQPLHPLTNSAFAEGTRGEAAVEQGAMAEGLCVTPLFAGRVAMSAPLQASADARIVKPVAFRAQPPCADGTQPPSFSSKKSDQTPANALAKKEDPPGSVVVEEIGNQVFQMVSRGQLDKLLELLAEKQKKLAEGRSPSSDRNAAGLAQVMAALFALSQTVEGSDPRATPRAKHRASTIGGVYPGAKSAIMSTPLPMTPMPSVSGLGSHRACGTSSMKMENDQQSPPLVSPATAILHRHGNIGGPAGFLSDVAQAEVPASSAGIDSHNFGIQLSMHKSGTSFPGVIYFGN